MPPEVRTMASTLNVACHGCSHSIRRGHQYVRPDSRGPAWHLTCWLRDIAIGLLAEVA